MYFSKPSIKGFPIAADPADRRCRYLVQPPTVPSLERLRGLLIHVLTEWYEGG
jgi:hypothetical protein